ncbi:peptidase domain-containing ABC transporter [Carnobacterium divergens]|uniref:peptidase domain-containing ABC transporter n=2 Tax=Carnobacterium TaxID=2747 RepID=UPI0035DFB385
MKVPISVVRDYVKVDKMGASIYGIVQGASRLNINAEALEGNLKEFKNEVKNGEINLPIIAHTVNKDFNTHFIVILSIEKEKYLIFDPAVGKKTLNYEELNAYWTGGVITFEPSEEFYNLKNKWKPYSKYVDFFWSQNRTVVIVLLFSLFISGLSVVTSFSYQKIIDNFILNTSKNNSDLSSLNIIDIITNNFLYLFFALISLYSIQGIFMYVRGIFVAKISRQLSFKFLNHFYNHLTYLKESYFRTHETGDTIARYQSLTYGQNLFFEIFLTLILEGIMVFVGGWVLLQLNSQLFLITISIVIIYAVFTLLFIKPLNKIHRKIMDNEAQALTHINETLEGIETIKLNNAERFFQNKFKLKVENLTNNSRKSVLYQSALSSIIFLVESIGIVLTLMVGSSMVIKGNLTLGTLISFESLVIIFINPIKNLINIQENIQTAYITFDRLNDVFEIEREDEICKTCNGQNVLIENNSISLNEVSFAYSFEKYQIRNVSIEIEENKSVGLVGTNGSGKTTFLKLISSILMPNSGDISIGNINYQSTELSDIRSNIAYVPQQSYFFNGSIEENLVLGNKNIDKSMLELVIKGLKIYEIEDKLMGSGSPKIIENGLNLSSGQKQKLGIARALIKKPKILLLDEATSNLDTVSENDVYTFIKNNYPNTSILSIYHDMRLAEEFEKIIVLDDGEIVGFDSHNNLKKSNTVYKKLLNEKK